MNECGKVYIVGAGPGDPELLTIKAVRVLSKAQVVLYDSLLSDEIFQFIPAHAELIAVGKRCGNHLMPQDKINQTLVDLAKEGKTVVRLKGGDPFVFGRGGEEVLALIENQISFEVVPGISSSVSAPMYAGVPLTHRNVACSYAVIAGHENPEKEGSQIQWDKIVGIDTLVFLMGVNHRRQIAQKIIQHGREKSTPVLFVMNGTTHKQKVIRTTLIELVNTEIEVSTPAVMVVGEVVNFHLDWFSPERAGQVMTLPELQLAMPFQQNLVHVVSAAL